MVSIFDVTNRLINHLPSNVVLDFGYSFPGLISKITYKNRNYEIPNYWFNIHFETEFYSFSFYFLETVSSYVL